jgi:hypothetical protein
MLTGTDTLATQSVTTLATDYTLSFSGTGTVTLSGTATGAKSAGTNTFTATAGTLTLTVSGTVTNAQLVASNQTSLPYQSVTSATVYDSDPSKFPWYLRFTDHWMVTPSIDASAYDKAVVFAAIRKMSDVARGMLIEMSATFSVAGTFRINAPNGISGDNYELSVTGALETSWIASVFKSPISSIISCVYNINGADRSSEIFPRVNALVPTLMAGGSQPSAGSGMFSNNSLYIGKRGGTALPFNGHLYGLTVLFPTALPNDNLIQALERHYAAKTGIVI